MGCSGELLVPELIPEKTLFIFNHSRRRVFGQAGSILTGSGTNRTNFQRRNCFPVWTHPYIRLSQFTGCSLSFILLWSFCKHWRIFEISKQSLAVGLIKGGTINFLFHFPIFVENKRFSTPDSVWSIISLPDRHYRVKHDQWISVIPNSCGYLW